MKKPYAFINDHLQTYITLKTRLGGNARFDALNGHIKNDMVIPGQLVIVSDDSKRPSSAEEIELMRLASHVRHQLANDVAGGDGHVIRHYDLLQQVMGYSAIGVGAATGRWDKHLAEVKKTLEDTERLHKLSLVNGTSNARQTFIKQRRALFTTLDQQLQGIACWGADLNNSQSIKKMLGTSTKSYLHTGELQGYVKTIGGVARAAHWLKKGTAIGMGLNMTTAVSALKVACSTGLPDEAERATGMRPAASGSSLAADYYLGENQSPGQAGICVAVFATPTQDPGALGCGIVAGSIDTFDKGAGGETGGEVFGERLHEWRPRAPVGI